MHILDELVATALGDFRQVAKLADAEFIADSITVEIMAKPHKAPTKLPSGKMAVYAFFLNGQALKVGTKSVARYTSQHYNPESAKSTLAQSILKNAAKIGAAHLDPVSVGNWIRTHTDRVNLLAPTSLGLLMLSFLESFLHVRWKPIFEGRVDGE
jgi:hypothetical protein